MGSQILWSIGIIIGAFFIAKYIKRILYRLAIKKGVLPKRTYYIVKVFESFTIVIVFMLLSFIWSFDIRGLSVFASSLFAVIGVALFAQWSILSNVTASLIIFFNFPAKVGDKIRIIDGDNSIEGIIKEITLFQMELVDSEGNHVFYPNNLILQKPVMSISRVDGV